MSLARVRFAILIWSCLRVGTAAWAEESVVRGEARFAPGHGEQQVAPRFQLTEHTFPYELRQLDLGLPKVHVWDVRFPSTVVTPTAANNTVHCEFFCPRAPHGKRPAVIVLHILGGDFPLARLFCLTLAERGTAALFLKMPYYGPRRDPQVARRMISNDPRETVEGMTQAVLDIRRAAAWLAGRDDIDSGQLGVFGISLGGITGALAATAEPRLTSVCLVLAGGDLGIVAWESRELERIRRHWQEMGRTREEFLAALQCVDPVVYAANARHKRILMLNASEDEVVPRACTESLWRALGEPPIHWYPGGHYSVARYLVDAMNRVGDFFAQSER